MHNAYRTQNGKKNIHIQVTEKVLKQLERCQVCIINWITVHSFLCFLMQLSEIENMMETSQKWKIKISQIRSIVMKQYDDYFCQYGIPYKEDLRFMKDFIKEIELELQQLQPIPTSMLNESEFDASRLVQEVKDAVQKGNRTNFKLIQELQQKLDELSTETHTAQNNIAKTEFEKSERKLKDLTVLLLETFDLIDLISEAVVSAENNEWSKELKQVTSKALQMLEGFGFEEINVQGLMFNGEIMEGIGTVSQDEVPSDYQKYQVYKVVRRGFCYKDSKETIRKSRVITVS